MPVADERFGDLLEWDGDAVVFDYEHKFRGTFGVTGRVIERSDTELRFEAETETGFGVDEPDAEWTGRLERKPNGTVLVWAEAQYPYENDYLKGTVKQ